MAETRLAVSVRTDIGSARSGRMRKEGRIPAVVYGTGHEPIAVSVDAREFRIALSGEAGLNALLDLDVDGQTHAALAREIQRHPVRGTVQHVDFQIVRLDQAIVVDVPVELTGEAEKVTGAGGKVIQDVGSLTVTATPRTIPQVIEVDIARLTLGGVIRLGDVTLPEGVTCEQDPDTIMVTGLVPRGLTASDEESGEGEEGAAGEGEGGEAAEGAEGEATEGGDAEAAADGE